MPFLTLRLSLDPDDKHDDEEQPEEPVEGAFYLLLENGDKLLLESADDILLESSS